MLGFFARAAVGAWAVSVLRPAKAAIQKVAQSPVVKSAKEAVQKAFVAGQAAAGYDVHAHHWTMAIDVERCIGCGSCATACKNENHVIKEPFYFRTWVERYIIRKPSPDSVALRGETLVDSPNGGIGGFSRPFLYQNCATSAWLPRALRRARWVQPSTLRTVRSSLIPSIVSAADSAFRRVPTAAVS